MSLKATILDESILHQLSGIPQYQTKPQTKQKILSEPLDEKEYVRKAFNDIYKGIMMTKTNNWNQEPYGQYGIYKARLNSYTAGDNKIIIAFVYEDYEPIGTNKIIDALKWTSFQTREITNTKKDLNGFVLSLQNYMITNNSILHDRIKLVNETPAKYVYKATNLPIKVEILKLKEDDHYSDEGSVWAALETFATVVTFQ